MAVLKCSSAFLSRCSFMYTLPSWKCTQASFGARHRTFLRSARASSKRSSDMSTQAFWKYAMPFCGSPWDARSKFSNAINGLFNESSTIPR